MRLGVARVTVVLFVLGCFLLLACVVTPVLYHIQDPRSFFGGMPRDLEQVRGMGNAFTLYYKKYGTFPALVDMGATPPPANIGVARKNGGYPECLALKLLMAGGFIEDAKMFFCVRDSAPTMRTLTAMQANLDPRVDPTWACTYAYGVGHSPNDGSAVIFGNTHSMLQALEFDTAHVLSCEMVAHAVDADGNSRYVIPYQARGAVVGSVVDDIYADDSAGLGWCDSDLVWDVAGQVP